MDSIQRAHIEQLLQLNRAHLRELETQQAKLGVLAPSGIAVQLAEYQRVITDLEHQLADALPRHNLPPRDYERFVGRQPQLEEVRRLLLPYPKSRHHLVTIDGIGGIGKSALALETAYQARDSYASLPEAERFEAIVWVSAKRTYLTADGILEQRQAFRALDDLYTAIAQVLDYPAITRAPTEEQRAIVERVLAEQRTLLILDNLETVDDEELLIFLRLLPDPTKAIVTTRHRIDVAYPVRLLGMPQADALALIGQEAARKGVALEQAEQEQLFARTGGVPLAIVWSIGLMGLGGSAESVLRRLGSGQSDIARFCFDESVALIRGRDAHKLLLALALFASDASREALGIVAGLGEDEFGRDIGLEELLRLSLVNKDGERFSLLPLTKSFVQAKAENLSEWMDGARERWIIYYDNFVERYSGWSEDWRGHDRVERELVNIFAVFETLVATLQYEGTNDRNQIISPISVPQAKLLLRLVDRVARTCRVRGHWSDCERIAQKARDIGKSIDRGVVGWLDYTLARISFYRSNYKEAKSRALEMKAATQLTNDLRMSSRANLLLGLVEIQSGNFEEADELLSFALQQAQESGRSGGISNILAGIGELLKMKGSLADAIIYYEKALDAARQRNDIPKMAAHFLTLGRARQNMGDIRAAQFSFEESLKLARECGLVSGIAGSLYSIAVLEYSQNQRASAESNARQALDLFRRLGMKREQAEAEALLVRLGESDH
jgi:tetratricopeptide (TPR) repeat protein